MVQNRILPHKLGDYDTKKEKNRHRLLESKQKTQTGVCRIF